MRALNYLLFFTLCFSLFISCKDDVIVEQPPTPEETPEEEIPEESFVCDLKPLHVEGRYLKDAYGNLINLHGTVMGSNPYFAQNAYENYDVDGCIRHNKKQLDGVLNAGWKFTFLRLIVDAQWFTDPKFVSTEETKYDFLSEDYFQRYMEKLFVPLIEYTNSKGLYVVIAPPSGPRETIAVGDDFHQYIIRMWDLFSRHPKIRNNPGVMFELFNEPVNIKSADGTRAGNGSQEYYDQLTIFCQAIVDKIRGNQCNNIIWVPGLGYQSQYAGYATNPVKGENVGYAVHVYPGWYGSDGEEASPELGGSWGGGYQAFQRGWDEQVGPAAKIAPIMVTEMDWAPSKYNSSWGKSYTGVAGDWGFGANFKYITDREGNVSWVLYTGTHLLLDFKDIPGEEGNYTFLNDPEACPWPVYHWLKEYAGEDVSEAELVGLELSDASDHIELSIDNDLYVALKAVYSDGSSKMITGNLKFASADESIVTVSDMGKITAHNFGETDVTATYTSGDITKSLTFKVTVLGPFALTKEMFNPVLFGGQGPGSFDETTKTLTFGEEGKESFSGWHYNNGLDLSNYSKIRVELESAPTGSSVAFRLIPENTLYTMNHIEYKFNGSNVIEIDLHNMISMTNQRVSPDCIYYIFFFTKEPAVIVIKSVTLI